MMAGTLNADHKGGMDCTLPQYTARQPSLPITNFNTTGGKEVVPYIHACTVKTVAILFLQRVACCF